ncbi:MAG: HAMP domain-containing protein [Leptospiraceae bacterium]|nr:HAMP domain-containing protein [Leptospiraceae bacterium]MCP5495935.1 HAMP domain-containing protein [Leptospiraceae bacterium]
MFDLNSPSNDCVRVNTGKYDILSLQTEQFLNHQVKERARSLELQFEKTQSIASYMLLGSLAVFGISLLVGSLFIHQLLIPLQQVSGASRSMAAGDFQMRVKVNSNDEIGHLAQVFN